MKKILTLLVIFALAHVMSAQVNLMLEPLLDRYEVLKNSPLSFDQVLRENFNADEQYLLLNYLRNTNTTPSPIRSAVVPDFFLAQNIRGGANTFGTLDGTPPYDTFNVINANGLNGFADDFDGNGVLYAIDYDSGNATSTLVSVDPGSGSFAVIDDVAGITAGHAPSGLSFNFDDGIMYGLSTNGSGTQLYSVNLLTGVFTPIGSGVGANVGIWLEIDNNGDAWMADAGGDQLYSVNLATGSGSAVGPLDIDINFAQDASFDHSTGELFMAAYQGGGTGGIYTVNTNTGLASFLGETDALDAEFGMFSVPPATAGVGDLASKKVSVYPNPVQNELNFELVPGIELQKATLYNVLGSNTGIQLANGKMDVSSLPQGIYILIMETSEGKLSQKVVKQ